MKRSLLFLFTAILLLTFVPQKSLSASGRGGGGFFLDETFVPVYVNRNDTCCFNTAPGVATQSGLGFDLRTTLGYTFGGNYLVGVTYNTYSLSTKRAAVSGGDSGLEETTSQSEMGPTLGYVTNGWRVLATYFISGSKSNQRKDVDTAGASVSDITIKNSKLSGFQLAFGYTFALGSYFEIGPSLVYKSLTYTNQEKIDALGASGYADSELYTKAVENTLTPMISMQLRF
ncbi:hypothetical protein [Bdellovibrio sp. HCB337]|uniref:hypothetical protein n=1 Tax=Bdellovibrio sp. HCB337 TaxID=3394358 RepID=UPI0039A4CB7E